MTETIPFRTLEDIIEPLQNEQTIEGVLEDALRYKRFWEQEKERARKLDLAVMTLEDKNTRLLGALHDAINRPKGVVPQSAEEFYDYRRVG